MHQQPNSQDLIAKTFDNLWSQWRKFHSRPRTLEM